MSIIPENNEGKPICMFCLEECAEKNTNRFGCECGIVYHEECLDTWIKKQNNCPICRINKNQDDIVQIEASQVEIERVNNKLNILMTVTSILCFTIFCLILLWLITSYPIVMDKISNNSTNYNNFNNYQLN